MLDEPSAGFSPKLVEGVFASLGEIRARGVAIVLVEQNARAALAVADRGVILVEGRNRHEGRAPALWGDPGWPNSISRPAPGRELQFLVRRASHRRDDRPRRDRRDAHLFDPALRQFRPWRVHRLGRLSRARRRERRGMARRRSGGADRALFVRLGPRPGPARRDAAHRAARARPGLGLVRAAARHGEQHHRRDGEFGASMALRNLLEFLFTSRPAYFSRELQIAMPWAAACG